MFGDPRWSFWKGWVYAIRDEWKGDAGVGYDHSEYATYVDGNLVWKPCAEGVLFKDIEPLCTLETGNFIDKSPDA